MWLRVGSGLRWDGVMVWWYGQLQWQPITYADSRKSRQDYRGSRTAYSRILGMLVLPLISMSNQQTRIRGRKGYIGGPGEKGRKRNKNENVRRVDCLNNFFYEEAY